MNPMQRVCDIFSSMPYTEGLLQRLSKLCTLCRGYCAPYPLSVPCPMQRAYPSFTQTLCNCDVPYAEGCDVFSSMPYTEGLLRRLYKLCTLCRGPCVPYQFHASSMPYAEGLPEFYQTLCNCDPMQRVLRHCQFYCSWPSCVSKGL